MLQKMCIWEFDILFVIYFLIDMKYYNLKQLTNIIILIVIFISFRLVDIEPVIITTYYFFQ
jgi:hypothetical protein